MTINGNTIIYPDGSVFEVSSNFRNANEYYGWDNKKAKSNSSVTFTPQDKQNSNAVLFTQHGLSSESKNTSTHEGWNEDIFFTYRGDMCGEFLVYYSHASGRYCVVYCIDGFTYSNLTKNDFKEKFKSIVVQKAGPSK